TRPASSLRVDLLSDLMSQFAWQASHLLPRSSARRQKSGQWRSSMRCGAHRTRRRTFRLQSSSRAPPPMTSSRGSSRLGHVDVFFVESPPLFIGLAALTFQRLKRAPFIFNVSDIWPQSAVELGALKNRLA